MSTLLSAAMLCCPTLSCCSDQDWLRSSSARFVGLVGEVGGADGIRGGADGIVGGAERTVGGVGVVVKYV